MIGLQPDEGQEESDTRGGADPNRFGDQFGELGPQPDCGNKEENQALHENRGQGALVGDVTRPVKPDDGVSEVGVGAHSGSQGQRKVGEGTHDQATDEGRSHGGHDEVFPDSVQAGGVTRVHRVELAGRVGLDDAEAGPGAVGDRQGGVGAEGDAVGDRAGAARVREDGGVHGEDVGHGEEGGGAGAELGGECRVALGEFESLADSALGHVGVEAS